MFPVNELEMRFTLYAILVTVGLLFLLLVYLFAEMGVTVRNLGKEIKGIRADLIGLTDRTRTIHQDVMFLEIMLLILRAVKNGWMVKFNVIPNDELNTLDVKLIDVDADTNEETIHFEKTFKGQWDFAKYAIYEVLKMANHDYEEFDFDTVYASEVRVWADAVGISRATGYRAKDPNSDDYEYEWYYDENEIKQLQTDKVEENKKYRMEDIQTAFQIKAHIAEDMFAIYRKNSANENYNTITIEDSMGNQYDTMFAGSHQRAQNILLGVIAQLDGNADVYQDENMIIRVGLKDTRNEESSTPIPT